MEQPPLAAEELEVPCQRAPLAAELRIAGRGRAVVRPRLGLEDRAVAAAHDPAGQQDVVEQRIRWQRLEERAADGIDGAGRADGGGDAAPAPPGELLVAPAERGALPHPVAVWTRGA